MNISRVKIPNKLSEVIFRLIKDKGYLDPKVIFYYYISFYYHQLQYIIFCFLRSFIFFITYNVPHIKLNTLKYSCKISTKKIFEKKNILIHILLLEFASYTY